MDSKFGPDFSARNNFPNSQASRLARMFRRRLAAESPGNLPAKGWKVGGLPRRDQVAVNGHFLIHVLRARVNHVILDGREASGFSPEAFSSNPR